MTLQLLRRPILVILAIECVAAVLGYRELGSFPDKRVHAAVLDIGQGDSSLIVSPSGKRIIIDGGRDNALLRHLGERLPLGDRRIDLLVMTHPQMDHMFAFPDVVRRYDVRRILLTGVPAELPRYRELLDELKRRKIPAWIADPAIDIDLGDGAIIDVVWPPVGYNPGGDINDTSIVLRVLHGTGAMLFTGDIEERGERALLRTGADLSAHALKAGHHGSKTSSGTGFLLAVRPSLAAISCGKGNSYGHPHKVILERLRTFGITTKVTAEEGSIEIGY